MKCIANIFTNGSFEDELYNITSKKDDLIEGIPTLIIGWEFCKKNFEHADILTNKVDESTFWTYGKREKRDKYEEMIDWFKEYSIKKFIESVNYNFINILAMYGESKDTFYDLFKNEKPSSYFTGEMCYINKSGENIVYGVSLRDFDYIGVDPKKMAAFIYKNSIVVNKKETISQENKSYFNRCKYVMPYLLS